MKGIFYDNKNSVTTKNLINLEHLAGNFYIQSLTDYKILWFNFSGTDYAEKITTFNIEDSDNANATDFLKSNNMLDFDNKQYIKYLEKAIKANGWISKGNIFIAEILGLPELAERLTANRLQYIARQEEKEKAEQERKDKEKQAHLKEKNEAEKIKIDKAINSIKESEKARITNEEYYLFNEDNYFYGVQSCVFEKLFELQNIKLPIKLIGWMREHLFSVVFENKKAVQYQFSKGHKSTTIFNYLEQLQF